MRKLKTGTRDSTKEQRTYSTTRMNSISFPIELQPCRSICLVSEMKRREKENRKTKKKKNKRKKERKKEKRTLSNPHPK